MRVLCISFFLISTIQFFADAMHGGHDVSIEKVPYMAQLFKEFENGEVSFCGAAALSEQWFLSAAHCVIREKNLVSIQMRVRTNKTLAGGDLYNISQIIVHKKYSPNTRWNSDLTLIKLEKPIEFDNQIKPISIAKKAPKPGDIITVAGFGNDYTVNNTHGFKPHVEAKYGEILKKAEQKVISRNQCREAYRRTSEKHIIIDDRNFCVESSMTADMCGGDSGSPSVLNGKVVGIAAEGCDAINNLPNIYVTVAHYYDWIVKTTGIKFD